MRTYGKKFQLLKDEGDKTLILVDDENVLKIDKFYDIIHPSAYLGRLELKIACIPERIKEIGDLAFCGCKNLKNVIVSKNVKKIGRKAFKNCVDLKDIEIKEGLERIDSNAFENCFSLESISLPDSLKEIGENIFFNSGVKAVYCHESLVRKLIDKNPDHNFKIWCEDKGQTICYKMTGISNRRLFKEIYARGDNGELKLQERYAYSKEKLEWSQIELSSNKTLTK